MPPPSWHSAHSLPSHEELGGDGAGWLDETSDSRHKTDHDGTMSSGSDTSHGQDPVDVLTSRSPSVASYPPVAYDASIYLPPKSAIDSLRLNGHPYRRHRCRVSKSLDITQPAATPVSTAHSKGNVCMAAASRRKVCFSPHCSMSHAFRGSREYESMTARTCLARASCPELGRYSSATEAAAGSEVRRNPLYMPLAAYGY